MMGRNPRSTTRRIGMLLAALAFATAGAVSAQPAGHFGHGPGGGGLSIERAIGAAKSQLNLNTSQQQMWDANVALSKSTFAQARANREALRTAVQTELAKDPPDLRTLAGQMDALQAQNHDARTKVRNAWLQLYETFTPEQKAVVKQILTQRLSRMEQMRQHFLQRHPAT